MVYTITKEIAHAFEHMIEPEMLYPLEYPGRVCLGAAKKEEDHMVPTGILTFDVGQGSGELGGFVVANLTWLYVAEEHRQEGIATELMETFYQIINDTMSETELIPLVCDVPFPEEYNLLCAFLEDWGFEFKLTDRYILRGPLKHFMENDELLEEKKSKYVKSFAELTEKEWTELRNLLVDSPENLDYLESPALYEENVSCVFKKKDQILGAFLIRKVDGSMLIPTFLSIFGAKDPAGIHSMISYAMQSALEHYSEDLEIIIECKSKATANIIAYMYEDAQPILVRRGFNFGEAEEDAETEDDAEIEEED